MKMAAYLTALVFLALPASAFADSSVSSEIIHQTAISAAISAYEMAQTTGKQLACGTVLSKQQVQANEPFVLAWGSIGAMSPGEDPSISMWTQDDAIITFLALPGTWTYRFTFYAKDKSSVTCTAHIQVLNDASSNV